LNDPPKEHLSIPNRHPSNSQLMPTNTNPPKPYSSIIAVFASMRIDLNPDSKFRSKCRYLNRRTEILGRPISNIFSQGEPHQSENMDSSPLLSHNIDQSVGRGFEKIVTKLIECDVEIETVQVIR
jgi:hypothetical protein